MNDDFYTDYDSEVGVERGTEDSGNEYSDVEGIHKEQEEILLRKAAELCC